MHLDVLGRHHDGGVGRPDERLALGLRGEQMPGIGMLRVLEQLGDRPGLDDLAVGHHADPIGDLAHDRQIVGDQQHRHPEAALQVLQQGQDLGLDGDVERRGRLVGDQQIRLIGERHRDHHALSLAAGQLMGVGAQALLRLAQAHQVQQLQRSRARLRLAHSAVQHQGLADLAVDRVQRVERGHRLLKYDADAIAAHLAEGRLVGADQLAAIQADAAARMPGLGIGQQLQDRERGHRLARAALADQRQGLALVDVERDPADRLQRAALDLEADREVLNLEQAHAQRSLSGRSCGGRSRHAPPRR